MHRRHALTTSFSVLVALLAATLTAAPAQAIVGGTDQVSEGLVAPLAFIQISEPTGLAGCSGTLIAPAVVMTAAHCVYETTKHGNLLGIARPSAFAVRVGSRDVSNSALGVGGARRGGAAAAVLPLGRHPPFPRHRAAGARSAAVAATGGARRAATRRRQIAADRRLWPQLDERPQGAVRAPSRHISTQPTRRPAIHLRGVQPLLAVLRQRCLRITLACRVGRPASAIPAARRSPPRTRPGMSSSRESSATARGSIARTRAPTSRSSQASAASSIARSPPRRLVEPAAGRSAHRHRQARQAQGRPDGVPVRADRRRQEGRSRVDITFRTRRTAGRAGLPQHPHEPLGEFRLPRQTERAVQLDLRAGHRQDQEAVEQGLRARRRAAERASATPAEREGAALELACISPTSPGTGEHASWRRRSAGLARSARQARRRRGSTVMDHLWQIQGIGSPENPMLEAYTTLGFLAGVTSGCACMCS